MGDFKAPVEQKSKTASPVQEAKETSSLGEMEFVDSRASTFQLVQLQAAADDQGSRSRITQLQSKSAQFSSSSRIAQLQAKSNSQIFSTESTVVQRQENKTGLPDSLKSGMESISGLSLHDVKVHRNSDKPAQLQAHAYAQGTDIHLGPGQEKHLPHELGHVVQQKEGRVKPTVQLKDKVNINDDSGLEKEADVLGQKALNQENSIFNSAPKLTVQTSNIPTVQRVIQKVDTLKSSDAQTTAAKNNPVDSAAKAAVNSDSINDPTKHPMYSTFQARINQVFSEYPAPDGFDVGVITRNIWTQICSGIGDSSSKFDRLQGNDTYSDVSQGYVNMGSSGYKESLTEFDSVMKLLKGVTNTQFMKAKSFGFWSKPEGREFAEQMTDLTLETSGIGSLFDGMPSLNAHQNGWDVQLWGSLSQAFGQAVAKQMTVKGKEVHVCAGGGTDKTNIFGMLESKALEKGAANMGKSLEEAVIFHSVAAISKKNRKVDTKVKDGSMGLPGTWYSGHSWDDSLRIGKAKFDALPD